MDQADVNALQDTISSQDALLRKHDQLLASLLENSSALSTQVNNITTQLTAITGALAQFTLPQPGESPPASAPDSAKPSLPVPAKEPHTVDPEPHAGDPARPSYFSAP